MDEEGYEIKEVDNQFAESPYIDIYCIGKAPSGEGILFFYRTKEKVLYAGAIDACIDDSILKENGVEKLNLICWSHPHKDHFEGIDKLINKYADENTKILIPPELSQTIFKHKDKEEQDLYKKIVTINANGKKKSGTIFYGCHNKSIEKIYFLDRKNGIKSNFSINTHAPIDNIISRLPYQKSIDYNDYSIILEININNARFIFTGDVIKSTIEELKKMKFSMQNVVYVKIPHHGSESSIDFIDLLKDDTGIAVTTIFKDNGFNKTPCRKVINRYFEKNFNVFTTNGSYWDGKDSEEKIGIISTRIVVPTSELEENCDWSVNCIKEGKEILREDDTTMLVI